MNSIKARVIAFYLPQFHPIPENDLWWGKGFTEWTNVGKAKPLFKGHYQPRVPADLGYYDLRMPEIREAQAEMARNAGIEGFMYWHYWFGNGRRALERPFKEVLKTGKPEFPFCLGWANHSWTSKTWEKGKSLKKDTTIFEQLYPGNSDNIEHFYTVLPAFRDSRYITIEGKPIFLIYDPQHNTEIQKFIEQWRILAKKEGLNGLFFIGLHGGWDSDIEKIINLGFDAVNTDRRWEAETKLYGYYKKMIMHKLSSKLNISLLQKFNYNDIWPLLISEKEKQETVFPTVIPQWDRSARNGRKAIIYHKSSPELFSQHVKKAVDVVKEKPNQKKVIFLKSWNEWAEGNYMEPDIVNGHGYLNALKNNIITK